MSDEDDYGFEYSDEEELDDEQIDAENEYYNAKGTMGRRDGRSARARDGWSETRRSGAVGWKNKRRLLDDVD
jgi:COP9 signalosome complex subunit 2